MTFYFFHKPLYIHTHTQRFLTYCFCDFIDLSVIYIYKHTGGLKKKKKKKLRTPTIIKSISVHSCARIEEDGRTGRRYVVRER